MNDVNPLEQTDFYKVNHKPMYPENTLNIVSNLTPRKSRMKGVEKIVIFGIQYWILEYVIKQWNNNFFNKVIFTHPEKELMSSGKRTEQSKDLTIGEYTRMVNFTLGKDTVNTKHIEKLWELGYMPLEIKALPEGTLCPIGVPCMTIEISEGNREIPLSQGGFAWLVNYLETISSCTIWQPITSATIAYEFRKLLNKHAIETTGSTEGVQWQGHDFSMRGMSSLESACTSGAGHLLSFTGTDTIPAISFLERYYGADIEKELVGASVPATEHSVMCMGTKDDEIGTFERLIDLYKNSPILSIVSDTWNLWDVVGPNGILSKLKKKILAGTTKIVIRPDSGDPVDIICGTFEPWDETELETLSASSRALAEDLKSVTNEEKGVVELLWDLFGGTYVTGSDGVKYKMLDSHVGAIYGDSISLERADSICKRLKAKGFASTNIVFGIGSYSYQYNTRDTFGFAIKATYGELLTYEDPSKDKNGRGKAIVEAREIFKDPITDDGTKKSAKGLITVMRNSKGEIVSADQSSRKLFDSENNLLEVVFRDGKLLKMQKLSEIRERLASSQNKPVKIKEKNSKFEVGDEVICINNETLKGLDSAPQLERNVKYTIQGIILDSGGNPHLDVGLPSLVNYVRSWETKEELPNGDKIHWCHPSRFKHAE